MAYIYCKKCGHSRGEHFKGELYCHALEREGDGLRKCKCFSFKLRERTFEKLYE